ncbi:MAG: RNA polymerase-binding protein DksA [Endozoicomonadaceae bacterium]|nr:RNA polymerase-binding protein DksA [Endozoicomonadaceae bacterium]
MSAQNRSSGSEELKTLFTPYQATDDEEYMSEKQLTHFFSILKKWKKQLVQEITRTVSNMQDEANSYPDPADRASKEEEFNLELRTRDRERKLIKKIESTLLCIDQNDYGFCDKCGIEIGIRRLEARPTATLCIDCKKIAELKEQHTGSL